MNRNAIVTLLSTLQRFRHLHAPSAADGGVRHVAIAADLIRSVDLQGRFPASVERRWNDCCPKHTSMTNHQ
jgi:hypothetical protein